MPGSLTLDSHLQMELGQAEQDIQTKKEQLEELLIQVKDVNVPPCCATFAAFADSVFQEPNEA